MIALAWRNLWRQPRRTLLTGLAIAFAALIMVGLLALQLGTYAAMKDRTLRLFDGHAQLQTAAYRDDPDIRHAFDGAPALARAVMRLPGIEAVAERAEGYALLSNGERSHAALVVGVQPQAEARVSRLAATVTHGRFLRDDDGDAAVLGGALARTLRLAVGDRVTVLGVGRDGSVAADVLHVVGIFASGLDTLDRGLLEMPLARFQGDFALAGGVHALVVVGTSLDRVDATMPQMTRLGATHGVVVRGWADLEPGLRDAIRLDASTSMLWYVALVVVVVAILLNTILMSVLERTREFGLLLALGMRPAVVGRMVWIEIALLLGLALGVAIALGTAGIAWADVHGIPLPGAESVFAAWGMPARIRPALSAFSLLAAPTAIAACTALAALYPFWQLHRLEPVAAMRAT